MWFWNCTIREKVYHWEDYTHKKGLCGEHKGALHFRLQAAPTSQQCNVCKTILEISEDMEAVMNE